MESTRYATESSITTDRNAVFSQVCCPHFSYAFFRTGVENTAAVEPNILFPKSLQSRGAMGSYSVSVQVTPNETVSEE